MKPIRIFFFICAFLAPFSVQAEDITREQMQDISTAGYPAVASLLQSMTPEQRAEVMRKAREYEKHLRKMTPAERDIAAAQATEAYNTLKVDEVDPQKLQVKKAKSLSQTQREFVVYKRKYDAGKIDNAVVKPKIIN